jgi:hypothetical protein
MFFVRSLVAWGWPCVTETCSPFEKSLLTPYFRKESCDLAVINKAYIKQTPAFTQHDVRTWFWWKSSMSKYLSNEIEFLFNRKTNINLLVSNKTCTAPQCAGSDFQARHHKHRPIMTMTVHSSFYFSSFLFAFVRVRMDKIKSHLFIWGSADCNRNLIPAPKV